MIWSILALIGGGTFIFNGLAVLTDPDCASVDFSGGRAVLATCYTSSSTGAVSGNFAGLGMILFGGMLLYISWRSFRRGN
jgi:hypothetical protein